MTHTQKASFLFLSCFLCFYLEVQNSVEEQDIWSLKDKISSYNAYTAWLIILVHKNICSYL